MPTRLDYRLVMRSDGHTLLLTVEGAIGPDVGRHVREVTAAAAKLGIPVRVEHAVSSATRPDHQRRG